MRGKLEGLRVDIAAVCAAVDVVEQEKDKCAALCDVHVVVQVESEDER